MKLKKNCSIREQVVIQYEKEKKTSIPNKFWPVLIKARGAKAYEVSGARRALYRSETHIINIKNKI